MSNNNGTQPTGLYAWLLGQQKRITGEIDGLKIELEEVEIAMAALAPRQAPPMQQQTERAECRYCSGPIARQPGQQWVHDRDGGVACKPGHSGPLAEPLEPTGAFPAVQPGDATQVIPAVPGDWDEYIGRQVRVIHKNGETIAEGTLASLEYGKATVCDETGTPIAWPSISHHVASIHLIEQPADLDTPTATPAQDGNRADG